MKSTKVKEIIESSDNLSYKKNHDLSESTFSYSEVLELIKLSNDELGIKDSKSEICKELMKYLESKSRVIDLPRPFYSDEVSMIVEISELNDKKLIEDKITEFKRNF
jgi:hypothetical protein